MIDTPDGAQVILHNTRYQLILVCGKSSRNSSESEASLLRCCVVGLVLMMSVWCVAVKLNTKNQTRLPRAHIFHEDQTCNTRERPSVNFVQLL